MFQPHLTDCCGKHLSQKAVTEIQRENRACPLCNKPSWKTMLDKKSQRQVNELHVFCRYRERGCGWKGSLCEFKRHIKCCVFDDEERAGDMDSILLEAVGYLMHQENCRIPRCPCKQVKKRFQYILPQTRFHMQQEAWFAQQRRSRSMDFTPLIKQPEWYTATPGFFITDRRARQELLCSPTFSPPLSPTSLSSLKIVPPVLLREISLSADDLPSLFLNDCSMAATPLMSKRKLSSLRSLPSSMTQHSWSETENKAPKHSIETDSDSERKSSSSVDSLTTNQEENQISIPSPTNHPTSREDFLRQIRTRSGDSGIETSTATQYQPPGTSGTIKYRTSDGRVITVTETLV